MQVLNRILFLNTLKPKLLQSVPFIKLSGWFLPTVPSSTHHLTSFLNHRLLINRSLKDPQNASLDVSLSSYNTSLIFAAHEF